MAKPNITTETLKRLVPLSTLPERHLQEMLSDIGVHHVPKGRILFKRNQPSDKRFYLIDGSVDLCDADHNVTTIQNGTIESHQPLNKQEQTHTGTTTSDSFIVTVDKNKLDFALTWSEASSYGGIKVSDSPKAEDAEDEDWMSALLQSELFTQVPPTNIQKLFSKFKEHTADADEAVVRQGEEGANFYVIRSGEAQVSRQESDSSDPVIRAHLGAGDFFGEDALISDMTRNATVTMTCAGSLMYLTKEDFKSLLHQPVLEYVSPQEMQGLADEGQSVQLIDVRLPEEYQLNPTEGSVNIPLLDLRKKLDALDSADTPDTGKPLDTGSVYIVCADGSRRSEVATHLLKEAGITAYVLKHDTQDSA